MGACAYRDQVQGRVSLLVGEGGVCAVCQQQGTQLRATLLGRLVQRRERPLVRGVDTSVELDEQGGDIDVLGGDRKAGWEKNCTKRSTLSYALVQDFSCTFFSCVAEAGRKANPMPNFPSNLIEMKIMGEKHAELDEREGWRRREGANHAV